MESHLLRNTRATASISSWPKSRSLSGMFQFGNSNLLGLFVEEHSRPVRKKLLGLRIVVGTPDIEPKSREGPGADFFPGANQLQHKVRKIEIRLWLDKTQHSWFVDINAHADIVAIFRLFAITGHE